MTNTGFKKLWLRAAALLGILALVLTGMPAIASAQGDSRTFPETGKTVKGRFLAYWVSHGGLAQQGFPISEEMQERSDVNGQVYTVQYFERAVFEYHPENQPPHDVLLSLLGRNVYRQKYPNGAPNQRASTVNPRMFPETGKTIGGRFRQYWEANGGLAQQGFPLTDEFQEVSDVNGQTYTVQYFERAVFEYHPENQPPHDVLLSLLGRNQYRAKYAGGGGQPPVTQPTQPPAQSGPQNVKAATSKRCIIAGEVIAVRWDGFTPNEPVSAWISDPNGTAYPMVIQLNNGQVVELFDNPLAFEHGESIALPIGTDASWAILPGYWAATMKGAFSGNTAIGYFYVAANSGGCAGR